MRDEVERQRIVELDKRHVWHPYTPMGRYIAEEDPLVIERAEGARLYDANGRTYIDGNASWWTSLLGHNHPRLIAALKAQADRFCHTSLAGITHAPAAELAKRLVAVAPPGLTRVFYSDNGSTAVEMAMKLALKFWGQNGSPERQRFVALESAFHGETLGVTALGGVEVFRRPFSSAIMDCLHVPPATTGYERSFEDLEQILRNCGDTIAAVVLEPVVQGAAGMRIYDAKWVAAARELTTRYGTLLVLDEVFTGYGRTGPMWAADHAGIAPDILCTAKGFCGGMLPMAATLVTEELFDGFLGDPSRALHYGHTFCGNPLGAAVALEVLRVYEDEQVLEVAERRANVLAEAFRRLGEIPGVCRARSLGMVAALDLSNKGDYLEPHGWRVYREALKRGAYVRPLGDVVYLTPPLNISEEDLAELLSIVEESVAISCD